MRLVPIPLNDDVLGRTAPLWMPFLQEISKDSEEPLGDLISQVVNRQIRIALAFNDDGKAVALVGVQLWQRGPDLIGDIKWTSGKDRHTWQHLLTEVESLLRQAGCIRCRPLARPGWSKLLKEHGYKMTHVFMEKPL